MASEELIAQPASDRRSPRRARAKKKTVSAAKKAKSAYERASCEYQTRKGLTATIAAASTPARRETSVAAAPYATGTVAVPTSAESERSPASPKPKIRVHGHART